MDKTRIAISYVIVYTVLILLCIKLLFSYLDVEIGWWIRHLTPNFEKHNYLQLPKNFSEIIEYGVIPLLMIHISLNFKRLGPLVIPLVISFVMFFLNLLTAYYTNTGLVSSLNYSLKIVAPVYFFIVLILHHRNGAKDHKAIAFSFIVFCCFLTVFALLFFDISYNRGAERFPLYFSGLHTHSYVLAAVFTGICFLLREKGWWMYLFMIISLAFLVLGWNVRTAVLFYCIVIGTLLLQKNQYIRYFFAKGILLVPILLLMLFSFFKGFDWDTFSSGRVTMYETKLEILENYKPLEYMIGRGKGSDLVTTSEWWYTKKTSHNDFLTYTIENGFIFVLFFLLLVFSLFFLRKQMPLLFLMALIGYFATSAISNGFAVRPLAAYLLFMMLSLIYIYSPVKVEKE